MDGTARRLPDAVAGALNVWLDAHDSLARGLIEGLYVVGSAALEDWRPDSDIDVVALTADPATDEDAAFLQAAHDVASELSSARIDGPRLAWGDVTVPPTPLHRPWTLDGHFHHDGECFEINPITWYVLATRAISVRGPGLEQLDVWVDADERISFVRENVDTYWRSVADIVAAAADEPRDEFDAEMQEWCVLGVARTLVTVTTGEVVSKTVAGEWAAEALPGHADVIRRALAIRDAIDPGPVERADLVAAEALMRDVITTIAGPSG